MKTTNTIYDVAIIGAGAAGLNAARELSRSGKTVLILEARNRIGGRIHTIYQNGFQPYAELGAEFIHGELSLTLGILKEAELKHEAIPGEMWQHHEGKLSREDNIIEDWPLFMEKLALLEQDMSVNAFLEKNFSGNKYVMLKESVRRFAEGYDTADPDRASILALRDEWKEDTEGDDFRPSKGYGKLVEFLSSECIENGCIIHLETVVKEVHWSSGNATIAATNGNTYNAGKIIITIPTGVLLAEDDALGSINFSPALPDHKAAFKHLGYGAVIKILLQFTEAFWESKWMVKHLDKELNNASFIFSEAPVPTWWTQNPHKTALLTGWIGGPKAMKMAHIEDEDMLQMALESLAFIFQLETDALRHMLSKSQIVNWTKDPFTRGSYSYATVGGEAALDTINTPVANTIYFAGEACESNEAGTVEAALISGKKVAEKIIAK